MPKKKNSKKHHYHKKSAHQFHFFIIASLASILLLIGVTFLKLQDKPFCANSISCISDLSGKYDSSKRIATFMEQQLPVPAYKAEGISAVLGAMNNPNKHISIDLSSQRLYAYEGNQLIYNFLISSGKWAPTPTGNFHIWIKLRYVEMSGGAGNLAYDVPNVPNTMFFAGDNASQAAGYAIHGAYWHNNFGHPMSHGCINLRLDDAAKIYDWADPPTTGFSTLATTNNPGTPITIYGTVPSE